MVARSILAPCLINPAQFSLLVLQTLYQCSLEEPYKTKLRLSVMMRMRRTLQKFCWKIYIRKRFFNIWMTPRCDCVGCLGSRSSKNTLGECYHRSALDSQLWSEKVIFFLHLLGLDTMGHSYGPHSKVQSFFFSNQNIFILLYFQEYMENIRVVDNIVREAEDCPLLFYD